MKFKKKLLKLNLSGLKKSFIAWIPIGVTITGLSGLAYLVTQQNIRLTANDPQIQIAEDVTNAIGSGTSPDSIVPPTPGSDMSKGLGAYVIIYKDSGDVVGSSVQLDNQVPKLPSGVLQNVAKNGEERFTWEPKKGVREAVVVKKYNGGFVLAGRSLREIEKREDLLLIQVVAAWGLIMIASFASKAILDRFVAKKA